MGEDYLEIKLFSAWNFDILLLFIDWFPITLAFPLPFMLTLFFDVSEGAWTEDLIAGWTTDLAGGGGSSWKVDAILLLIVNWI